MSEIKPCIHGSAAVEVEETSYDFRDEASR